MALVLTDPPMLYEDQETTMDELEERSRWHRALTENPHIMPHLKPGGRALTETGLSSVLAGNHDREDDEHGVAIAIELDEDEAAADD
jgi:hypothetical protein